MADPCHKPVRSGTSMSCGSTPAARGNQGVSSWVSRASHILIDCVSQLLDSPPPATMAASPAGFAHCTGMLAALACTAHSPPVTPPPHLPPPPAHAPPPATLAASSGSRSGAHCRPTITLPTALASVRTWLSCKRRTCPRGRKTIEISAARTVRGLQAYSEGAGVAEVLHEAAGLP